MNADYDAQLAAMEGYTVPATPMPGEQQSQEWAASRRGNCTGSRFAAVMDFRKDKKEGATRAAYRLDLVIERVTGVSAQHFVSDEMQWGIDNEAAARMAYEAQTGAMVMVPGYKPHPTIAHCGGSVDGLVDDDGIIEIKCPKTTTHCKTLLGEPCAYLPQIQGYLWITGRQWADYVSYDPRLPAGLQLYVQRIKRDDDYIAELAGNVIQFLAEVDEQHKRLMALASKVPV